MERTLTGSELNKAKELLAFELTKLVHGDEEAQKAQAAAKAVFGGTGDSENMPTTEITAENLSDGEIGILDLLVLSGLAPSKGEGRRLVQQGGISVNDEKITDPNLKIAISDSVIIKKGKKVFHKVVLK